MSLDEQKEKLDTIKKMDSAKGLSLEQIRAKRESMVHLLENIINETVDISQNADMESKKGGRSEKIRFLQLLGNLIKTNDDILTRIEDAEITEKVDKLEEKQIRISQSSSKA